MSHTRMILLQGQHCVQCSPMDCLHLLIIHSFSGSSPFPSKGLNGPHISSRSMTELDCKGMTRRMYGLNFYMALVFASLISVLLDRNTHTHTRGKKKSSPSENGYDESRIAPLGNFLSFFSFLLKIRAFVTGIIILFHLLYFFF